MDKLCSCLLNVSDTRMATLERIAMAALKVNDVYDHPKSAVLNIFSDLPYNRSVITIASDSDHIGESIVDACTAAFNCIDLEKHSGDHPRLGAVDLVPIHPLSSGISLDKCGDIAREIASKLSNDIKGTSFFYFGNADIPLKRTLVQRRKDVGWFSGKFDRNCCKIIQDCGELPSKRYGLTGIGAMPYVMNCNVTIDSQDLSFGKHIAQTIRATTPGGLPGVRAMAFPHEGKIEIACNVEAFQKDLTVTGVGNDNLHCSFGIYYHVPGSEVEKRIRELASEKNVATVGQALIVGFSPDEAKVLGTKALETKVAEFWRTRNTRTM